jgi:hypothetical protein
MEQREALNVKRKKQGIPTLRMHPSWTNRPKLNQAEWMLFVGFTEFAAMCAGEPTPQALLAWFDLKELCQADREWMIPVYTRLSSVLREPADEGEQ